MFLSDDGALTRAPLEFMVSCGVYKRWVQEDDDLDFAVFSVFGVTHATFTRLQRVWDVLSREVEDEDEDEKISLSDCVEDGLLVATLAAAEYLDVNWFDDLCCLLDFDGYGKDTVRRAIECHPKILAFRPFEEVLEEFRESVMKVGSWLWPFPLFYGKEKDGERVEETIARNQKDVEENARPFFRNTGAEWTFLARDAANGYGSTYRSSDTSANVEYWMYASRVKWLCARFDSFVPGHENYVPSANICNRENPEHTLDNLYAFGDAVGPRLGHSIDISLGISILVDRAALDDRFYLFGEEVPPVISSKWKFRNPTIVLAVPCFDEEVENPRVDWASIYDVSHPASGSGPDYDPFFGDHLSIRCVGKRQDGEDPYFFVQVKEDHTLHEIAAAVLFCAVVGPRCQLRAPSRMLPFVGILQAHLEQNQPPSICFESDGGSVRVVLKNSP